MIINRRSVTPILTLQAGIVVVLTSLVILWVWQAVQTRDVKVEIPRNSYENIDSEVIKALSAVYNFAIVRDPALLEQSQRAMAEARAGLGVLDGHVSKVKGDTHQARTALNAIESSEALIFNSSTNADLSGALEELSVAQDAYTSSMGIINGRIKRQSSDFQENLTNGLLALWAVMLLATLGSSLFVRRQIVVGNQRAERAVERFNGQVGSALEAALAGEPAGHIDDIPELMPAIEVTRRAAAVLTEANASLAQPKRDANFLTDLMKALTIDRSARDVLGTIARSGRIAYPEAEYRVILINPITRALELPCAGVGELICTMPSTGACPAIQKGHTLHQQPGESVARCPHVADQEATVSCTPVMSDGEVAGLTQLSGYKTGQTLFDDMEILALALGSRVKSARLAGSAGLEDQDLDGLTKLANRGVLDHRLDHLDKAEQSYAVLSVDIDGLGKINENVGTRWGDRCIEIIGGVLRQTSRGDDLPARTGGEEFMVVLAGADMRNALGVAMRIRSTLARKLRTEKVSFTISIGVAAKPEHGLGAKDVLAAATGALELAKAGGHDQIVPAQLGEALEAAPA